MEPIRKFEKAGDRYVLPAQRAKQQELEKLRALPLGVRRFAIQHPFIYHGATLLIPLIVQAIKDYRENLINEADKRAPQS